MNCSFSIDIEKVAYKKNIVILSISKENFKVSSNVVEKSGL